jgi:hypothetical protein
MCTAIYSVPFLQKMPIVSFRRVQKIPCDLEVISLLVRDSAHLTRTSGNEPPFAPELIDFNKADVHSGCGRALARVRFDVGRSPSRPPDESTSESEQRQR